MGQKVNPNIIRLGITKMWNSFWFSNKKDFAINLYNDYKIRKFLNKKLYKALVSKILIERFAKKSIKITIYTARPGIIIGKKGEDIEKLKNEINKITCIPCQINISEIRRPELDSKLIADNIVSQLERRMMFRRVMKRVINNALRLGIKGIKIEVSGRLGGTEIARREWYREGRVPLHTLRADIDYSFKKALTNYGVIGVKVWVFKGEILDKFYPIKQYGTNFFNIKKYFKRIHKKSFIGKNNASTKKN